MDTNTPRYHTVVPITGVTLEAGQRIEFGGGVVLEATPAWVLKETMLNSLNEWDRRMVKEQCPAAFTVLYPAASLGEPDPDWHGQTPRSIQEAKVELCVLANLALWISRPSPAQFYMSIHGPQFGDGQPIGQRITAHLPLRFHPRDGGNRLTTEDLTRAAQLHRSLISVARDTSVWTAARASWAALQLDAEDVRYALFWIALEAIFGPDDPREMTFRLSQRLALFLAEDGAEARELFAAAKDGYSYRSRIVHGRWKSGKESLNSMAVIDHFVRRSLRRILGDDSLLATFSGKARESFLDDLIF